MKSNRSVNLAFEVEENKSVEPSTNGVLLTRSGSSSAHQSAFVYEGRMTVRGRITTALSFLLASTFSILLLKSIQIGDMHLFCLMALILGALSVFFQSYVADVAGDSFAQGERSERRKRENVSEQIE